tara:strand:+ start:181 stop:846 length:666 start_codon:yes stop_codon:yes gene_type:complete
MNQDIIYDVYLMPGMAANPKIFEFIKLPENFKTHHLEWQMPYKNELISEYALRISSSIKGNNIVLIGVSFGGIIVQEISKIIKCKKVIIISSVKSNKELPLMMQIGKKTKAYKFLNINWIHDFESLALFVFGPIVRNRIQLYRKYLSVRDENYLKWSIHQIVNWEQKVPIKDLIHIHGTIDLVFPSVYIKNAIFVSGGNHAMILRKANWFNKNLPKLINED